MAWCKNCKYEYEEGVKICADCGAELVEKLEEPPTEDDIMKKMLASDLDSDSTLKMLFQAKSDEEANGVISLLDFNGIKCLKRPIGAGSYLSIAQGFNSQGVNILVLDTDYDDAKTVIDESSYGMKESKKKADTDSFMRHERVFRERRRKRTRLVLFVLFALPPLVVFALQLFVKVFELIKG